MRRSQSEDLTEHGHLVLNAPFFVLLDLLKDSGDLPSVHFAHGIAINLCECVV